MFKNAIKIHKINVIATIIICFFVIFTINNFNHSSCSCGRVSYSAEESKKRDAFLCSDLLATEKHASSLYDTCVFEFADPQARQVLNHIQTEEQEHGLKLYEFMNNNGMYS